MSLVHRAIRSPVHQGMLSIIQSDSTYTPAKTNLRWGLTRVARYAVELWELGSTTWTSAK